MIRRVAEVRRPRHWFAGARRGKRRRCTTTQSSSARVSAAASRALRLAEKGYRVAVLEKGKRWRAEDFPKTNWNLRRWLWMPALGLSRHLQDDVLPARHGPVRRRRRRRLARLREHAAHPAGRRSSRPARGADLADWKSELPPHYATARRMLGVTENPLITRRRPGAEEMADEMGRGDTFHPTDVAVYFGEPGKTRARSVLRRRRPRAHRLHRLRRLHGRLPVNAKNTLDKNYLYLAEQPRSFSRRGTRSASSTSKAGGSEIRCRDRSSISAWGRGRAPSGVTRSPATGRSSRPRSIASRSSTIFSAWWDSASPGSSTMEAPGTRGRRGGPDGMQAWASASVPAGRPTPRHSGSTWRTGSPMTRRARDGS